MVVIDVRAGEFRKKAYLKANISKGCRKRRQPLLSGDIF